MTPTRTSASIVGAMVLLAVGTVACARKPTIVHIKNDSSFDLTSVVLSGSGFRVKAPNVPSGGSTAVAINCRGESGLAVAFVAQGRTLSTPTQSYFEEGGKYEGDVVIKGD